ncbi:MAG: hypothetical protein ABGW69_03500 [Nanoarchaeota archaeon]
MKKSSTVIALFVLLSLVIIFYQFLSNYYLFKDNSIKSLKKEIAYKTLRNSILLLNFYEPVEFYNNFPINKTQFLKFSNLNVKFCDNKTITIGKHFLYYNNEKKCVIVN